MTFIKWYEDEVSDPTTERLPNRRGETVPHAVGQRLSEPTMLVARFCPCCGNSL